MRWWPLTVRGAGAVALAVAAFVLARLLRTPELVYVGALLVMILVVSLLTVRLARGSESVARTFTPDAPHAGDRLEVHLELTARRALPQSVGRWVDTVPAAFEGQSGGVLPAMPAAVGSDRSRARLSYPLRAERRGVHEIGPLRIVSIDPFGLVRRARTIRGTTTITVAPRVADLAALTDPPGEAAGSMHSTTNDLGQGTDNLVPRAYLPGDSMRRIHWRASARRDTLMVRQEEKETTPEASVVLDLAAARWPAAAATPGADPGFEAAVSAAASVTARLLQEGYRVRVIDAAGTELAAPLDGEDAGALERLTIGWATLSVRADADGAVSSTPSEATGPLVFLTGILTVADAAALTPLAHASTFPVLLCARPEPGALAEAAQAGWRPAAIDADPADAWRTAIEGAA